MGIPRVGCSWGGLLGQTITRGSCDGEVVSPLSGLDERAPEKGATVALEGGPRREERSARINTRDTT